MGKSGFFPRLALRSIRRNSRFYLPYLLALGGTAAAFYIVSALAAAEDLPVMTRFAYLSVFMQIGTVVAALFAVIFLTYANSFLMKRRRRELGLYHILGMGKVHIALLLGMETVYTALLGIGGGLALGLLLQKLVTLLLCRIMNFDAYFGFYISWKGIRDTVVLFGAILLGNLLLDLLRMGRQSPMELLREGSAGEREPKTKWLTALLGVVCLGGGYAIALLARSAGTAFALYFPAVILVILGTYALFSAVSIVALKALRRNKRFYYQTSHFIGVSGMLYRMRRNAVGLANICILSTMVLVMVSGTLSLYLNSQRTIEKQFPGNVAIMVKYNPEKEPAFDGEAMAAAVLPALAEAGHPAEAVYRYCSFELLAFPEKGGYARLPEYQNGALFVNLMAAEDYISIFGDLPGEMTPVTFRFPDGGGREMTVNAVALKDRVPAVGGAFISAAEQKWLVVEKRQELLDLYAAERAAGGEELMVFQSFWNAEGTEEALMDLPQTLEEALATAPCGSWVRLLTATKAGFAAEYYSINGGFFFLGIFLGLLFIMAAVLIIYYKQISEGYEDRERYRIMREVGLEPKMVRQSINSQILVVFFAPLLVTGVHVAFDYGLMLRLLTLFGLHEPLTTLACTAGTFLIFAVIYALVFALTARTYGRIVG